MATAEQRESRIKKDNEIRERFTYHAPTPVHQEWFDRHTEVMEEYLEFLLLIPDGQQRAVALTQFGLVRMLVNATIINTSPEKFTEYNS